MPGPFEDPAAATPPALQAWPYLERDFTVQAQRGKTMAPRAVVDGVTDWAFRPMTLAVGVLFPGLGDFGTWASPAPPDLPVARQGDVVVQVRGMLNAGGFYMRRFALPLWRPVLVDVSSFANLGVDVLKSTLEGAGLGCVVSNRTTNQTIPDVLVYAEEYATAGTYVVPPGARSLVGAVNDPGFAWSVTALSGSASSIADPVVAGPTSHTVQGTRFLTTVNNFIATWRVSL